MRFFSIFLFAAAAFGQEAPKDVPQDTAQPTETRGMPARATPGDYQAHAEAGTVTIGAEFMQHAIPTKEGMLVTEDFVVVEAGIFGPAGAKAVMNPLDFSLRINGKKTPAPSEPYALVFKSVKDPEWEPPVPVESKAGKTSIGSGGKGGSIGGSPNGDPPPVVHVPIKLQREWNLRVQKSSFPEGDRSLPQAGLLYFQYRNKASSIHSLELIYSGPAGKATLVLNP